MLAFHGKATAKEKYLSRVRQHRKADELIKGLYWQGGKGCAVGCTVHSSDHSAYERELGIPETLARLEDAIFESLPNDEALAWPEAFLDAPEVGADLSMVWPRFALWLLSDSKHGVIRFAGERKGVADAISGVAALYARWVETGEKPSADEFEAAAAAAEAAEAAWPAAAAWAAAWAATEAQAAWAAEAAWAAAQAAWAAAWKAMAANLLGLLREAPVSRTTT